MHNLPVLMSAQPSGPALDEAAQAALRSVLSRPNTFIVTLRGPLPLAEVAFGRIMDAATGGLINHEARIGVRPPGVAPELQTTTYAARAAMAHQLRRRSERGDGP